MKVDSKLNRRYLINEIRNIDLRLMICYLLLIVCGLFIQLDITSISGIIPYFIKQFLISMIAIFFCLLIYLIWKIKWFKWSFWIFYIFTLAMLVYVLYFGDKTLGAVRSFDVSLMGISFSVQPSLLARLVLVILFARVLSKREDKIENSSFIPFINNFFPLLLFSGVYYILILKENHLSAVLTSGFTLITLLFLANIRKATIFILIFCVLLMGLVVIFFQKDGKFDFFKKHDTTELKLADEQHQYENMSFRQRRLESFNASSLLIRWLTGNKSTQKISNNNLESIFCLSTGKLLGTGPDGGMGKLRYLNEPRTDFVFAIITEEFGLLGALFVILLYMGLVLRGISISSHQKDMFARILGYGFSLNIFFNIVIHIGAVAGCLPTTGVTLPFISAGGSSIVVNSMAIGILLILGKPVEEKI